MLFNVYSVRDKISNREIRVFFAVTHGQACRDNIEIDLRSQKNPAGLPFNDLEYWNIARYDNEKHVFSPPINDEGIECDEYKIDILKSYQFQVEDKVKQDKEINPEKLDNALKS